MFIDGVRGWVVRPRVGRSSPRRPFSFRVREAIDQRIRSTPLGEDDVPATQGATDDELVRFVRDRAVDGADRNRRQALALLYTADRYM